MDKWRIAYPVVPPIEKVAPHAGYPTLGLHLRVEDGKLVEISHIVEVPEGGNALTVSYPAIRAICELLTFHWRLVDRVTITGSSATFLG
jgi:hypothetical protein